MFLTRVLWGLVLAGCVWGQSSAENPALVANKAVTAPVSPNPSTPNSVTPTAARKLPPEIPPLPEGKATLVGGVITNVDHVRDRVTLQVFGGKRTMVLFDERTRIIRDGKIANTDDLKNGQRAYIDTTLDGTAIFAKNIRVVDGLPSSQSSGQVVAFNSRNGELTLRDSLSPEPVKMHLGQNATIVRGDQPASISDLRPGTLVNLSFVADGETPRVRQVSIVASPGTQFVFWGQVEHLDLHRGLLVLLDPRDNRSYEVNFDTSLRRLTQDLRHGASVTVDATFDGKGYQARSITANAAPRP